MGIAIIGNSFAGISAAQAFRQCDRHTPITIISDEPEPFYSRCALMYYVMNKSDKRDTFIADEQFYRDLNLTPIHDRVVSVDAAGGSLSLEAGGALAFDQLLIASGARARKLNVPNEDARGIFHFVTLGHCDQILAYLPGCKRAVVIGGGLIGSEVVEAFSHLGLAVTYLYREERFYPPFCSKAQSDIIEERMRRYGVELHPSARIAGFEVADGGRVAAVETEDGERYACDICVTAIGVDPRIDFLLDSSIELAYGVKVDARQETSVPGIYAAGDCAEVPHPRLGTVVQKLWYTAGPQGRIAGGNMAGGDARYDSSDSYQSAMFMDLSFTSVGDPPPRHAPLHETTLLGHTGTDAVRLLCDDASIVYAASSLGRAVEKHHLDRIINSRTPLPRAEAEVKRLLAKAPKGYPGAIRQ